MLVFMTERLVFLSVPKTGTTAFETALASRADMVVSNPPELKHAPFYRYNRFFRPMFEKACKVNDMETLAVMREPVDWLGSWYRYRQRPFMKGQPNATHDMSFDDFVLAYCEDKKPGFANVGSQARFLEKQQDGAAVSHLFRYEDQPGLIGFLEDRLKLKLQLARENVSPALELHLSPKVEARLKEVRAEEFALYNGIA